VKLSTKTLITTSLLCFSVLSSLSAFEKLSTTELLEGYLQNDSSLKKYAIEVQKAEFELSSSEISNGFDINLSTGTMSFSVDNDGETGALFSVNPSVTATLKQYRNLGITVEGTIGKTRNDITKEVSNKLNSTIKLSADIISKQGLKREIELLKSERKVLEAKRTLEKTALTVESDFYKNVETLLKSIKDIINDENSLYSDQKDFESVKAKGYSTGSSTYRLAEMKVVSDQHNIEAKKRVLIHDYVVFYKKCGFDISIDMDQDFMELVPSDIQSVELLKVTDYDKNQFSKIESVEWDNKIKKMERETTSNFELAGNTGFTFKNEATNSNTINVGVSGSFNGITFSPTVSIPVASDSKIPSATLSVSFNPNTAKKNQITKATNELSEESDQLDFESAYSEYDEKIVELVQESDDLEWNTKTNNENLAMYEALEKDLSSWFSQGIIPETDYLSAKKNMQNYSVQKIINQLDAIIFNNSVKSQFVPDVR